MISLAVTIVVGFVVGVIALRLGRSKLRLSAAITTSVTTPLATSLESVAVAVAAASKSTSEVKAAAASLCGDDTRRARVLVTGFFDMLHHGHIAFLKCAAKHGDVVVVVGRDANHFARKERFPIMGEQIRFREFYV